MSGGGEPRFVTEHRATIGGREIAYTAIAGATILPDSNGDPGSSFFTFSYIAKTAPDDAPRPVAFITNGGPGASSLSPHIGGFGPRRVVVDDEQHPRQLPPFELADSEHSLLDVSDLVFMDYHGCGFSRVLPGVDPAEFQGMEADGRAVASFITLWLTEHRRWNSPKYLIGSSYGTVRSMVTSDALAGGYVNPAHGGMPGVSLNGVAVLGPYFGASPTRWFPHLDELYVTDLPTISATGYHHGLLGDEWTSLADVIQAAREFAVDELLPSLFAGRALEPERRTEVAAGLSRLTGITADVWLAHDLRMDGLAARGQFVPGRHVGIYDSRHTLPAEATGPDFVVDDPAIGQRSAAEVGAFNEYLVNELEITGLPPYRPADFRHTYHVWDRGLGAGVEQPQNYLRAFAPVMRRNRDLRFFVGIGAHDFVTTIGKAEHDLAHAEIPMDRTDVRIYSGGHALHAGPGTLAEVAADLRAFLSDRPLTPR